MLIPPPSSVRIGRDPILSAAVPQMTRKMTPTTSATDIARPAVVVDHPTCARTVGKTAVKLNWTDPNAQDAIVTERQPRLPSSSTKARQKGGARYEGARGPLSLSISNCQRWISTLSARQITASSTTAPRQPSQAAASGVAKPASAPPTGTAVCLAENTRERKLAGV
jgi:hypothetical protein